MKKDTFAETGQVSRPELLARPRTLARGGRIVALASVLAVAPMITGFPQFSSQAQAHPVKSQVRQLGFAPSSVASMRDVGNATRSTVGKAAAPDPISTARSGAVAPVQAVAGPVTVVGVTWPKGAVSAGDVYQIRTLTGATWSTWQSLDVEDGGPDRTEASTAAAKGTSPYVVTGASKYEVRSLSTDPSVPAAARIQVVDPGASDADSVQQAPGAASAAAARPTIYTRAQWGANESMRRAAPSYGKIMVGFVHHTDSGNGYTAASVPAMIRGMYAYHVQSLGWSDIGYNFLVDRFGRTWEGRYGGMDRAVIGAQTMNMNSVSMGVSAIGQYDIAAAPQAMTNAFKAIFAWKFSLAGIPATGTVVANGKSLYRVAGHKDAYPTACPGRYLYAKLPEIRLGAAALIGAKPPVVVTTPVIRSVIARDVDRNGIADVLSYSPGAGGTTIAGSTSVLAGTVRAPVGAGLAIGTGWNNVRSAVLSPDLTGDGKADIVALDPAHNRLGIYLGNGRGSFAGVLYRGPGWNVMDRIIAAGDRNRDGHNDILATSATGRLVFYAGNGAGGLNPGRVIGTGWNTITSLTSAGDLNGDTYPDLLGTRRADGAQIMYAGVAGGALRAGVVWSRGWGPLSPVIGGSDLDGDRYGDVFARLGDGMRTYSTDATGRFVRVSSWGAGWGSFTQLSTGADWNGDGTTDLLAVDPAHAGTMLLFGGVAQLGPAFRLADLATRSAAFPAVPGADVVRIVGDVNGDRYTDVVARVRTSNTLVLLLGQAGSAFAAPRQVGTGWNFLTMVEAAGDYDGDGVPDLLVRDAAGNLFVYPFQRNLTFKARMNVGKGFQGMVGVVGTGAFDRDAYADVIALRASDHALISFRGRASSGLVSGAVLARAQNDLTAILGVGDYNGDGTADLVTRSSSGSLWLYPGNGLGALGARLPIRGGEGAGHAIG
ncbi:MAG TPA: FG-GAP-like repeat-containing protein [Dermatophilaceae bacterium]